jgi:hypothetical protein
VLSLFLFDVENSPSAMGLCAPEIGDTKEQRNATLSEPSARMFEKARNVSISGGEFYNATGSINIGKTFDFLNTFVIPLITLFR